MTNRFFLGILILVFLSFPISLFYNAFYSGNLAFKNSVNNDVQLYYFLFMAMAIAFSTIVTKFFLDRNKIANDKKALSLLFLKVTVILYGIFLIITSTSRFISYKSEAIDVMFFKQEIWMLSSFSVPAFAWSQHFSPILIAFVPIFWLMKSSAMLLFLQATFVVSGAIPLYLAAKEKLQSKFLGFALAIAYLTFGGLQFGYAYGFHEIMLFPQLFFWAYYFLSKKRIKLYFLFVVLCLFVKEEVSFIMIFWGLYLLYKKNYRIAFGTIGLGIVWYLICFYLIFPHFNNGGGYGYWGQYPNADKGIFGIIIFVFSHPLEFLKTLITPHYKLDTVFHSFGNFSFLSFLYPQSLLMVIPSLFQKLLSSDIAAKNGFHYSAAITAVIVVSVIESINSLQKKKFLAKFITHKNAFLGIIIIYVACSANTLYGYHQLSPLLIGKEGGLSDQQVLVLNNTLDAIPPDATVAAQYYIRSHINKPYWQTYDIMQKDVATDYIIFNISLPLVLSERGNLEKFVENLSKEGKYSVVVNAYGTVLFQRKP